MRSEMLHIVNGKLSHGDRDEVARYSVPSILQRHKRKGTAKSGVGQICKGEPKWQRKQVIKQEFLDTIEREFDHLI